MVEENPEVVASITEGGDFKKSSEKSSKKTDTDKKSEDKKVEEVESASGEKVVRAAHVPVPSQVSPGPSGPTLDKTILPERMDNFRLYQIWL